MSSKSGPKPKLEINEKTLKEIERLSEQRFTQQQMHEYFGIGHDTWYSLVKKHPEMSDIIKRGRAKSYGFVVSKLMQQINDGNITAIIFFLKTQGKWSESCDKRDLDGEFEDKQIASEVVISEDPREAEKQYKKMIEG